MAERDGGLTLQQLLRRRVFARCHPSALAPGCQLDPRDSRAAVPYIEDAVHEQTCKDDCCPRCFFERGYRGELRRGSSSQHEPNDRLAWCKLFVFQHPAHGLRSWLTVRPYSWCGGWGVGCWLCNSVLSESREKWPGSFARVSVHLKTSLSTSTFEKHQKNALHLRALARLHAPTGAPAEVQGLYTGVSAAVPRIDKFFLVGTLIARHSSNQYMGAYSSVQALGSAVAHGSDSSSHSCTKILHCLVQPLREQDQLVIRHAAQLQRKQYCINSTVISLPFRKKQVS